MASVVPFEFPRHFRSPAGHGRSREELEQAVQRLEGQLAREREEGRAQGFAEALGRLQEERDSALLAATTALETALGDLDRRLDEFEQEVARLGAELALELADQLAGRALERDPALAIDRAIGRTLSQVRRGQPLQVRVAPACVEAVEHCLAERQAAERRRLFITVLADAEVPLGDVRISWPEGALLLDRQARRQAMADEIAAMLAA